MNLLEIRQKFRDISGRFDLVDDLGVDLGATFYINEGRKFLDRLDETQKSYASVFKFLQPNSISVQFPYCRAIKEVWISNTESRYKVEKLDLQEMTSEYLSSMVRSSGTPIYYSPGITRNIPENISIEDFEAYIGFVDVPSGNVHEYNSILFNVPAESKLMVDIRGLFYSMELVKDTDINYWSAAHPMLLIMAAMRQLEIINRNTQGVNDWTTAIMTDMKQLGMDFVEEQIADIDQMEG